MGQAQTQTQEGRVLDDQRPEQRITRGQRAEAAITSHPDWVIKASRQQAESIMAESIMNEGKAQYYGAATRWLGKARTAYQATGRGQEWQAYLAGLLDRHQRKYKLVPLLKALR